MEKMFGYILGHQSKLSVEEIKKVYEASKISYSVIEETEGFFVLKTEEEIFDKLGGSIKVFEIKETISVNDWRNNLLSRASKLVSWISGSGKVVFGVSLYSPRHEKKITIILGKKMKEELKKKKRNSRFLMPKDDVLSSVSISKNRVLEKGGEIIVTCGKNKIYLGLTIKVQDFEFFSKLDYGRPKVDAISGMLPPKLAQMMVNFLGVSSENKKLLDPFVGSGTVLQQAAILGFKDLSGTDISKRAVNDTEANLLWLRSQFKELNYQQKVFKWDVLKISELKEDFDVIVSEGYLGPPLRQPIILSDLKSAARELEVFYSKAFSQLAKILKKDGAGVVAIPFFAYQNETIYLKIEWPSDFKVLREDLQYKRPGQVVGRQILIFKKV